MFPSLNNHLHFKVKNSIVLGLGLSRNFVFFCESLIVHKFLHFFDISVQPYHEYISTNLLHFHSQLSLLNTDLQSTGNRLANGL